MAHELLEKSTDELLKLKPAEREALRSKGHAPAPQAKPATGPEQPTRKDIEKELGIKRFGGGCYEPWKSVDAPEFYENL